MNLLSKILRVAIFTLVLPMTAQLQATQLLPVAAFANLEMERITLSPSGQRVAMMVEKEGSTLILVQDMDHRESKPVTILSTDNKQFRYSWFRWANDERLIVGVNFASKRSWNDLGGTETTETRLLSVRYDGTQTINLVRPSSFRGAMQAQFQDRVIDWTPDNGKHILMELGQGDISHDPAVYSVDVETGSRSQVHAARTDFSGWMVDGQHRVRVGIRQDKADIEVHVCDPDGNNWRKAWSYKTLSAESVTPLGFGKDPNQLYIRANHNGHKALFTVDLRDPALKRTLKLADDKFDIYSSLVYSKKTGEVVGLRGSVSNGSGSSYWDPGYRDLLASIDDALPKRDNRLIAMSNDETRYIIYSSSDKVAGQFYFGDDRKNTLELFATTYPDLPAAQMADKQSVRIKARDGLELPGFLTTPVGVEAKRLPTVLLVHGGPQSHDDRDFDAWTQFLANRGYAVLQVNFRGSTGHGQDLMSAGLQRWGMEMQDDLTDAVQWAIKRGTTDPSRICVVGASYGGYAALMGVVKTPDLYRCAVSFAGVSDLVELGLDQASYLYGKETFERQIGSIDTANKQLRATSPRYQAQQIKVPVLLIHGTKDRSVPFVQGEWMASALSAAGKPYRFIKQEQGDHHLSVYEHRMQFFTELESFLAQNMGSGAPASLTSAATKPQ